MIGDVCVAKKKKSSLFSKLLLFLVFLAIGVGGGYYIANKYINNEEDTTPIATELGTKDITDNKEFEDTINELYSFLKNNVYLYNSKGMKPSNIDNDIKLNLAYKYAISNKLYVEEQIPRINYWNSIVCENNFLVDTVTNEDGGVVNQTFCTVKYISKDNLNKAISSIFDNSTVQMKDEYRPAANTLCLIQEDGRYICGKVTAVENFVTGDVTSKFEIVKVTLGEDNTITIYDKGYLLDQRSNVEIVGDYKNAYLHSYDAPEHYYELKSSDNLTFKHVFKNDNNKYYYVSSEVVK